MRDDCPGFVNAEWIPIRPNTDVALMLALAYEIQQLGAQDEAFLHSHCVGYQQLADYLNGVSDGVAKRRLGQRHYRHSRGAVARLARQLIGVRSFITCSYSVQRAHRGEQPYWMMIALSAMLGRGAAGRRLFLRSWLDERRRQPARGHPRADHAGRG